MNQLIQSKNLTMFIVSALVCLGLMPKVQAVVPPPDGGYPGSNTAEGTQALQSLTTGVWNTALGFQALFSDTTGGTNTATGVRALFSNVEGVNNTATGAVALAGNTTGSATRRLEVMRFSATNSVTPTPLWGIMLCAAISPVSLIRPWD